MSKEAAQRRAAAEGGFGSRSEAESLRTLCFCRFCLKLCVQKGAQSPDNATLNGDDLRASCDRHLPFKHLREGKVCPSSLRGRFIALIQNGRRALMAVDLNVLDAAREHTCANGDKCCAKTVFEEDAGRLERREICHGKLDALSRQIAPDASEGRVSVLVCDEANGDGGETENLTRLDVAEQSAMLNAPGEICENDVVQAIRAAPLCGEVAAAD